jgi:hypothetical protein
MFTKKHGGKNISGELIMNNEPANSVLDKNTIPILGWAGPCNEMINDKVMSGMAEAGFTISHSSAGTKIKDILHALDVAHNNNIRLMLRHPAWHINDNFTLNETRKEEIKEMVLAVRDHPGLYGYHLRDEPLFPMLDTIAAAKHFINSLDNYHTCYINHNPPIYTCGAPTIEYFWQYFIEQTQPDFLSYDHYPITVGTQSQINASIEEPNVFPEEKIIVKPDYFECLELIRNFSVRINIPFWAFTCSVRHGPYPTPTEGHIRFQLMNDLAYGARGLQYFTYAHDEALVRTDGSHTETWEIARRVNGDIHRLSLILTKLRNIGVWRTGSLWSGTRKLPFTTEHLGINCEGDPVTMGFFVDPDNLRYVLIVNGNPCSWSHITLKANVDNEKLYVVDPKDAVVRELWPVNPRNQVVSLAPGEGRLFQIGGHGEGQNY